MYKVDLKNIRKGYIPWIIFVAIGIFLTIIFGFFNLYGMYQKSQMDSSVLAYYIDDNCSLDSDGDTVCSPIYYYHVDSKNYECKVHFSSSLRVSRDQNHVYYDSNNPSNCVTDYTASPVIYMYFLFIIPGIFLIIGIIFIIKINKRVNKCKYLEEYGTLIKNLPYTMKSTNTRVNGRLIYRPIVSYMSSDGTLLELKGDPIYKKLKEEESTVDLLIDMSDLKNYYIDFHIESREW